MILFLSCTGGDNPGAAASPCVQEVVVYLHAPTTHARQTQVGLVIQTREEVDDFSFNSPEEAYKDFKRAYRGQPEVYEDKGPADFPGSFEVTLLRGAALSSFNAALGSTAGVDKLVPGPCRRRSGTGQR